MKKFIQFISSIGITRKDEEDTVLQKRFLVYQAILMSIGGLIWGILALLYHRYWQSLLPFGYVIITVFNMLYFNYGKNFIGTKTIQTAISLLLPFLFQWSLGGFIASGAVMLWALLSLVVSVLYQNTRTVAIWLVLFVILTLFSAIFDTQFAQMANQQEGASFSFVFLILNILIISAIILWLFNFMVRGKNEVFLKLKEAQKVLVQSEKMASLGELTAGIAHEIQNPLNFVNNFSEVNQELLEEMKDEIDKRNLPEAKILANDVIANAEKIHQHGKRADAIVKGMLQHSRTSSGVKEPVDMNALVDEYLRLAYHGLRAKDKSFSAQFHTELDSSLPKIEVIPQDIGRVLLNLINNAFYAVTEKKKLNIEEYEPSVAVSTKNKGNRIEIRVRDNGMGIPPQALDKIFQPFFTTKPAGQGTGLGLSLSYDIITKGHQGELKVETQEGEYSEFMISLPLKTT